MRRTCVPGRSNRRTQRSVGFIGCVHGARGAPPCRRRRRQPTRKQPSETWRRVSLGFALALVPDALVQYATCIVMGLDSMVRTRTYTWPRFSRIAVRIGVLDVHTVHLRYM